MNEPLAIKLQPHTIKDIIGQEHLIGKDKIITNLINNKYLFSMIFYGPPGIGKTSLALAIVHDLDIRYRILNATTCNKEDFNTIVNEAKIYQGIVLIMDEIHRLNKDKQDLLLPHLESGLITLIGMTTANPYHAINPAIRSRCHLFNLKPLEEKDLVKGIKKAIKSEYLTGVKIDNKAINYLARLANKDLRLAYNILELAYFSTKEHFINIDLLKTIKDQPDISFDNGEDNYYDTLSALQKAIRGSDVDAALHYLAVLILANDLESIIRRLSVIAFEDIGLANPAICYKLDSAINASLRVGFPEARIPLSYLVIEMCLSPKSNSAEKAIDAAIEDINKGLIGKIPDHIKITAKGYLYPHDYPNGYVKQQYLPDELLDKRYYIPKETSQYERMLKQVNDKLHE